MANFNPSVPIASFIDLCSQGKVGCESAINAKTILNTQGNAFVIAPGQMLQASTAHIVGAAKKTTTAAASCLDAAVAKVTVRTVRDLRQAVALANKNRAALSPKVRQELAALTTKVDRMMRNSSIESGAKAAINKEVNLLRREIDPEEMDWLQKTCPGIAGSVARAAQCVRSSEDATVPLEERASSTPKAPASGISTSFFVKADPSNRSPSYIVKPVNSDQSSSPQFPKGQGPIRERLAYTVQKELGMDCGVPRTVMTNMQHSSFQPPEPDSTESFLNDLAAQYPALKFDKESLTKMLCEEGSKDFSVKNFKEKTKERLIKDLKESLNLEDGDASTKIFEKCLARITSKNQPLSKLISREEMKALGNEYDTADIAEIYQVLGAVQRLSIKDKVFDKKFIAIWDNILSPLESTQPSAVSCQRLASNTIPMNAMSESQLKLIPPKEFEKFTLDLVLGNHDRGLPNILAKSIPIRDLQDEICSYAKVTSQKLKEIVDSLGLKSDSNIEAKVQEAAGKIRKENKDFKMGTTVERLLHGLVFAAANKAKTTYELVLIDHSQCLPSAFDPVTSKRLPSAFKNVIHEWTELPEISNVKLTGSSKNKILNIDIDRYINNIREDMATHKQRFGSCCDIDSSCYNSLKFNLVFLKEAVKMGLTLSQMSHILKSASTLWKLYQSETFSEAGPAKNTTDVNWKHITQEMKHVIKEGIIEVSKKAQQRAANSRILEQVAKDLNK